MVRGYTRRFADLFRMKNFDIIFIHREASPFGPPLLEWLFMKVSGKYSIFDFDDAIWIPNVSETNWMTKYLKRFKNTNNCCHWASTISAGNKFLADYARQFNPKVIVNPTTIDIDKLNKRNGETEKWRNGDHVNSSALSFSHPPNHLFTIGWTGSHSTVQYLDYLVPVLLELEKKFSFQFHVICDVAPKFQLRSMKFIKWSKQAEIDDLLQLDVGVMPLPDNVWTRGKCGFKAIQYMALGIPAVVSDVGINAEIVNHDVNGCVCKTAGDWHHYLSKLMSDKEYLNRLSNRTREKIFSNFSTQSNKENFLNLFKLTKNR